MIKKIVAILFVLMAFTSCVTKSSQIDEKNNKRDDVSQKESKSGSEKEATSSGVSSLSVKAYSFIPSTQIPSGFVPAKTSSGEYKFNSPLVATVSFLKNTNKENLCNYEELLVGLTSSQSPSYFAFPKNSFVIPYKATKALIDKKEREKIQVDSVPAYQWASGLCGGECFFLFKVNQKSTSSDYNIEFSADLISTLSGQTIFSKEQSVKISKTSNRIKSEAEVGFSNFYKEAVNSGIEEAKRFFSFGKYIKLQIEDETNRLSPSDVVESLNESNINAKFSQRSGVVLIFDLWYNGSEVEFEKELRNIMEKKLLQNSEFDFILQDQVVYYYQVVDSNEGSLE